jgi:hypothetical protein
LLGGNAGEFLFQISAQSELHAPSIGGAMPGVNESSESLNKYTGNKSFEFGEGGVAVWFQRDVEIQPVLKLLEFGEGGVAVWFQRDVEICSLGTEGDAGPFGWRWSFAGDHFAGD